MKIFRGGNTLNNEPEAGQKLERKPSKFMLAVFLAIVLAAVITIFYISRQRPANTASTPIKSSHTSVTKSTSTAGKLEFRYLQSVKSSRHPNAKYEMFIEGNDKGEEIYQFTDSSGKTVDNKQVLKESKLILTEADLKPNSRCTINPYNHGIEIGIQFNEDGTKKFADFTKAHQDEYLAIIYNGKILSIPVVKGTILDGKAAIQGSFTVDEAKRITDTLNAR